MRVLTNHAFPIEAIHGIDVRQRGTVYPGRTTFHAAWTLHAAAAGFNIRLDFDALPQSSANETPRTLIDAHLVTALTDETGHEVSRT
jgi:hypothetical protein